MRQMTALGHPRCAPSRWAEQGLLDPVARGVYRRAGTAPSPTDAIDAALLSLDGHLASAKGRGLVTGAANLGLRGVEGFPLPSERVVLVVPRGRRVRRTKTSFEVVERTLIPGDEDRVRGRPATSGPLALADAADDQGLGERALRIASYHLVQQRELAPPIAVPRWRQLRGHAGARRLCALYDAGDLDVESEGEHDALLMLFRPHPPAPDCQVTVVEPFRADFAYVYAAMTIEYLGDVHRAQLSEDATRRLAHQAAGYATVEITAAMLRDDPAAVANQIHELRRQREALTRRGLLPRAPLPDQVPRRLPLGTVRPLG